jgi:phosphoglycolate phosphatase
VIRGILFDLDGVLVDSKAAWLETMNAMRHELGLPDVTREAFDAAWGQSTSDDARDFFDSRYTEAELTASYEREFNLHLDKIHALEPNTADVLDTLIQAHYPLAVATNAPRGTALAMLAHAGLSSRLPVVVTPEDVARPKPAPDLLFEAARRLDLELGEVLLVGDTIVDIAAAAAAGVRAVGYRTDGAPDRVDQLAQLMDIIPRFA